MHSSLYSVSMLAYIIQKIIQGPLRLSYKLVYRLEIRGHKNLKGLRGPILVVANHQSLNDAFLVASSLPFLSALFPVHYMAGTYFRSSVLNTLYKLGIITVLYYILGAISLPRERDRDGKVQMAIQYLKKKSVVVIFPEGGVSHEDIVMEFRPGAAAIYQKMNVPILPVLSRNTIIGKIRRKTIYFGKIYKPKGVSTEEITKDLRIHMISLYRQL